MKYEHAEAENSVDRMIREQLTQERKAVQWAAKIAANGVLTFKDANGKDPAWEHRLQKPGSKNKEYEKTLEGIIGNDPALTEQALAKYRNEGVRKMTERDISEIEKSYAEKVEEERERNYTGFVV